MENPHVPTIEVLHPRSLKHLSRYVYGLVEGRLWLKVIVGMVAGLAKGVVIGPTAGEGLVDAAAAPTNDR